MFTELIVIEAALVLVSVIIIRGVDQAYKGAKRVRVLETQLRETSERLSKLENDYMQLGADLHEHRCSTREAQAQPKSSKADYIRFEDDLY